LYRRLRAPAPRPRLGRLAGPDARAGRPGGRRAGGGRAPGLAAAGPHRPGAAPGGARRPAHPRKARAHRLRRLCPASHTHPRRRLAAMLARVASGVLRPSSAFRSPMMNPDDYCQQKAARSGSSFYYAFLFLPPEQRKAITALYAFCREVDDIVDDTSEPSVARMKLAWWRTQVEQMFQGHAEHPVMQALAPHVQTYHLDQAKMMAVIDGRSEEH